MPRSLGAPRPVRVAQAAQSYLRQPAEHAVHLRGRPAGVPDPALATGRSNILWRDDAGTVVLWEMNGPTIVDNTAVNTIPTSWHIV